ncbi:hypothetical protein [Massilia sp. MS-15]|uniref:hypothetical protein n=1 Tax=Massilia sp. MS-15 TaxID=2878200 RepID=UPI001CD2C371|nr:hypothetical protein [Massilia sp. MS-15]MCA1246749.1 hypothetical protein [Massilia sp. MS-15]
MLRISFLALFAASAIVLTGCAVLPAAEMRLPPSIAAERVETVQGLGGWRNGSFSLSPETGTFSRGRDRVELFSVVNWSSASTRYSLVLADGSRTEAACSGKLVEVTWKAMAASAKPFSFDCEWRGARSAQLKMNAPVVSLTMKAERSGQFVMGGTTLEVQSVHEVRGSSLPLEAPIGYVFKHDGKAVGAIELNGMPPRLWRPASGNALREPVTLAALALALLWDPAT